jgi:hypothetical protein
MASKDRQHSADRTNEVPYHRLPARLALRFLDLSHSGGIIYGTSQLAMADMLATYRKTFGSRLRGFRDAGLLKSGYRRIELRDVTGFRVSISDLPVPPDGQASHTADDEGIRR